MQSKDHVTHTWCSHTVVPEGAARFLTRPFWLFSLQCTRNEADTACFLSETPKRCQKERVFHLHASEQQRRTKDHQVQARRTSDYTTPSRSSIIMRSCHDQKLTTCLGVCTAPQHENVLADLEGKRRRTDVRRSVTSPSLRRTRVDVEEQVVFASSSFGKYAPYLHHDGLKRIVQYK